MKKIFGLALLSVAAAFAQSGLEGGTDGLHQMTSHTLGKGNFSVGAGGSLSIDSWGLSRGGNFRLNGNQHAYNEYDASLSGNVFAGVGLLEFLDMGISLPLYYEHANDDADGVAGTINQWTTSRGDLDVWLKIRNPFDTAHVFDAALLLNLYLPTGEEGAGVRPRHAWYLKSNGYTHPFTSVSGAFAAGIIGTVDLSKVDVPLRFNLQASYVFPYDKGQSSVLVYSAGVNWLPLDWMDVFVEYSGEMLLQEKGTYEVDPLSDPMVLTPGLRFHFPHGIDFAVGVDVAVRAFKNLGYDYDDEMDGCEKRMLNYLDEDGGSASYCYAPTPLFAGVAVLTWNFGILGEADEDGDGILDDADKCPHTPKGVAVDANGCPMDSDKDKIPDYLDKCPNTPEGMPVDSVGCPTDSALKAMAAADSASKALQDSALKAALDSAYKAGFDSAAKACSVVDSDSDGIADLQDKCPNTPKGVAVDSVGCPLDFDKDGVPDLQDKCPNTPKGVAVDSVGCPLDFDKDGVPDVLDKCPNTPQGVEVDTTGCTLVRDSDGDGVPDEKDKCPNTLKGTEIDSVGCPLNKKEDLNQLRKGIAFKTNSAELTKNSYGTLDDIAALMKKFDKANLEVQGHTDDTGSERRNEKLSQDRANAVVDYLQKKGVAKERLRAKGYGATKPVASNKTKKGRAQNRRVELVPFE